MGRALKGSRVAWLGTWTEAGGDDWPKQGGRAGAGLAGGGRGAPQSVPCLDVRLMLGLALVAALIDLALLLAVVRLFRRETILTRWTSPSGRRRAPRRRGRRRSSPRRRRGYWD